MFKALLKILLKIFAVIGGIFTVLFGIYFFNLDMKLAVNVIAPFMEKQYDKRERKQYV